MLGSLRGVIGLALTFAVLVTTVHAQQENALMTKEFRLERQALTLPGHKIEDWHLCLNGYRVMISGEKDYIPVFPVYTECCFKSIRARAVDVLERASNALDALLHGEVLEVLPPPENGNFRGSSIWTAPMNLSVEHPGLVFRIDENDKDRFGLRVRDTQHVARYVKDIFEVMRTLFVKHSNPSNSPAIRYPYVKILKRIWLDALQHAEKIRHIPPERSAESVTHEDIQEAIDMLSESQRLRLLGIAVVIPAWG